MESEFLVPCDFPSMGGALGTTPGSAQKSHGRRRFVPGSMAERLHRLMQRQKSEIRFWEHKTSTAKEEREGMQGHIFRGKGGGQILDPLNLGDIEDACDHSPPTHTHQTRPFCS